MDIKNFRMNITLLASNGIILSSEQQTALEVSLVVLKNEQKINIMQFWGKIYGINNDYFIAKGFIGKSYDKKRFFYSQDFLSWGLLNPPTEELLKISKQINSRFNGDPSFEIERKVVMKINSEGEVEEEALSIKEEDRLSCVISQIENEALIVPRGSFILTMNRRVEINKSFQGLEPNESEHLSNYMHFRKPLSTIHFENPFGQGIYRSDIDDNNDDISGLIKKGEEIKAGKNNNFPNKLLPMLRADFSRSIDFMEPISGDIPENCWSVQMERKNELVILKSLLWIGYVFFHQPNSNLYGSVYVGNGDKNISLPFML